MSFLAEDIRDGRFSGPKKNWLLSPWCEMPIAAYRFKDSAVRLFRPAENGTATQLYRKNVYDATDARYRPRRKAPDRAAPESSMTLFYPPTLIRNGL